MSKEENKCWSCGSFSAYYTKGFCCLLKENNGFCRKHNKIVEKSCSCDKWYCKRTSREQRIQIVLLSMPEIYNKIATVEQILMDEIKLRKDEIDAN